MSQALRFTFTLCNYSEDDITRIRDNAHHFQYIIFGKEIAPSTGTPHLQGYLQVFKKVRFGYIHTHLHPSLHLEVAKGSVDQNIQYCSKENKFEEIGVRPISRQAKAAGTQKRKRDETATEFRALMDAGTSMEAIADIMPGDYFYNSRVLLESYYRLKLPISRPNTCVLYFYGDTGVGKSRLAHSILPDAYIKDPKTKWWNGYSLQRDVIFDDFGSNSADINHLLRWFDRHKCHIETKGGMLPLYATRFIITSNFKPEDLFTEDTFQDGKRESVPHKQLPALLRRIIKVPFTHTNSAQCVYISACRNDSTSILYRGSLEDAKSKLTAVFEEFEQQGDVTIGETPGQACRDDSRPEEEVHA